MAKRKKGGESELRLIKRCAEFISKEDIKKLPRYIRGIYVLYRQRKPEKVFDVVYVGMARRKIKGRIKGHAKSRRKRKLWTHFSIFEVWDNIRNEEIIELEGILRHIYRKDSQANRINKHRSFKKLKHIRNNKLESWQRDGKK